LLDRAKRFLAKTPERSILGRELPDIPWEGITRRIKEVAENGDVKQLADILGAINVERARATGTPAAFARTT
jgi:hypothetical protein